MGLNTITHPCTRIGNLLRDRKRLADAIAQVKTPLNMKNAFVGHQLPFAADHAGNALHQRNIETRRAVVGIELKGGSGSAAPTRKTGAALAALALIRPVANSGKAASK